MKQEVEKWRPFGHPDGDIRDLSFLDAHQAVYVQHHEGKEGDGDQGTVFEFGHVFDFAGVGTKRLDVNLAIGHGDQAALAVFVVAVQVGLVLEEVGIELLVLHGGVGLHVVAEFFDLQLNASGLELGLDEVQDFRVRHGRGGHFEYVSGLGGEGQGGDGNGSQGFFQHGGQSNKKTSRLWGVQGLGGRGAVAIATGRGVRSCIV